MTLRGGSLTRQLLKWLELLGKDLGLHALIRQTYGLIICTGLALTILGILLSLSTPGNGRSYAILILLGVVLFSMVDALWLAATHWLNLSFGPIKLPWLALAGIRAGMFFLLIVSWLISNWLNDGWSEAGMHMSGKFFVILQSLILLGGLYAFYIEPFWITISMKRIETLKISTGKQIRIVQISDLHIERITRREMELIRKVNDLEPDVIFVTGDYPNLSNTEDPVTWEQITQVISQLRAKYGVFLIDGSVESAERVQRLADETGTTALNNQIHELNWDGSRVFLIGIADEVFHKPPANEFRSLSQQVPDDSYKILLFHTPDLIKEAAEEGIDLYMCGHTHGGQIRLPFYGALYTSSTYHKEFEMGFYQVGHTSLYVNRGVGMEGKEAPRARFLARPEIAVFDLVGTGE